MGWNGSHFFSFKCVMHLIRYQALYIFLQSCLLAYNKHEREEKRERERERNVYRQNIFVFSKPYSVDNDMPFSATNTKHTPKKRKKYKTSLMIRYQEFLGNFTTHNLLAVYIN